jgi:CYTH domain-containing protein/CHAD domain-containing protein
VEIERKFLVGEPPPDLGGCASDHIEQGYVALDGDAVEVRVRRRGGRATLTVKQGSGHARLEEEIALGRARFERLWELTEGRRLEKVRHLVPVGDVTVELDVYGGVLAGLVVAEVEFDSESESDAFRPPDWLGEEVTGDERYANRTLACEGWPKAPPEFRLGSGERVSEGLRRIVRARLDEAIGGLDAAGDDALDEAVHEARKSLKRVRTTLRLARDELGDDLYRSENAGFRDAGRRLSGARDSQVVVETLEGLCERCRRELPAGGFTALRDALRQEHEAARERLRADAGAVGDVVAELRAARARTASWPIGRDDLDALASGLRRIYRRGRKALAAIDEQSGDEALHELRKRAKDLWYASQILTPAAPKKTKKMAKRAHKLSDLIGEDHDLAVLQQTAERHREHLGEAERGALRELIERRRAELQRRALASAERLYRRKPRAAVRRMGLSA